MGVIQKVIDAMSRVLAGLAEMPWGVHMVVALLLAAGIVLWLTGERLIKSMVVIIATMTGAVVGVLAVALTGIGVANGYTAWHGLGVGAFVGLLAGLLIYRSAIALCSGVVFGVMAPMLAAGLMSLGHGPAAPARIADAAPAGGPATLNVRSAELGAAVARSAMLAKARDELVIPDNVRDVTERARIGAGDLASQVSGAWGALSPVHRVTIILCAAFGLAGGIILGHSMPAWATAATSSGFGAALMLGAFVWLSNGFGAPWRAMLDRPVLHWLTIWTAATLVGVLVQWSGVLKRRKVAAKPAAVPSGAPIARAA